MACSYFPMCDIYKAFSEVCKRVRDYGGKCELEEFFALSKPEEAPSCVRCQARLRRVMAEVEREDRIIRHSRRSFQLRVGKLRGN